MTYHRQLFHKRYRIARGIIVALMPLFLLLSTAVFADDKSDVEHIAVEWINGIAGDNPTDVYNKYTSKAYRAAQDLQQFASNTAMQKIQLGGPPTGVQIVGSTYFTKAPSGAVGDFYYLRAKATYPMGEYFIDFYLSKWGAAWRIDTWVWVPAKT